MGLTKRRLEAEHADVNADLRLCVVCEERIEDESDLAVESWRFEDSFIGPFLTVWSCGCQEHEDTQCLRCDRVLENAEAPLCADCRGSYEQAVGEKAQAARCARCSGGIPSPEYDLYFDTGLCAWCFRQAEQIGLDPYLEPWSPETDLEETGSRIITPAEFREDKKVLLADPRVLDYLIERPEEVFSLAPREFEEFVADLLAGFGYAVQLGPRGADGGVDVYAELQQETGSELVLVQCKRYSPQKRVPQPVVKQLSADVRDREASRGLVVTTSSFTKPALDYIEQHRYRLAGADFEKLQSWFRALRGERNGVV